MKNAETQLDPAREPKAITKEQAIAMLKATQPEYNDNRRVRSPQIWA